MPNCATAAAGTSHKTPITLPAIGGGRGRGIDSHRVVAGVSQGGISDISLLCKADATDLGVHDGVERPQREGAEGHHWLYRGQLEEPPGLPLKYLHERIVDGKLLLTPGRALKCLVGGCPCCFGR